MGSILGGSKKAKPAAAYAGAQFQPYTYTSTIGTTTGQPSGLAFNVDSDIDPQLTALQQTALGATQPFLQGYLGQAQEAIPMFSGVDDGEQRAADIFRTQSALLQPEFAQQRQQLQSDLFGRGRLGLQLAGETAGAGNVGMVQPDAYGLGLAQSRALAELSSSARTQAQGEQAQAFEQALGGYTTNLASRQQQLSNLLGGLQTGLGTAGTVTEFEQGLVDQGLSIEQARAAAQAASAQGGANLAQAGRKESGGMFGDLLSGAAQAAATYYGAKASDRKLKTNIRKVGELASGLNTYFWDWTEEAKKFVGNQMTFGVMAQEAMEIFPEAVSMHPDGYLQVDYSRIR